jgi:hypothetical protein
MQAKTRRQMENLGLKRQLSKRLIPTLSALVATFVLSAQTHGQPTNENTYLNYVEGALYKHYFPPIGGWELASWTAEVQLDCDGKLSRLRIMTQPRNSFIKGHPTSSRADGAIASMLSGSSPLKPPPSGFKCPAVLVVRMTASAGKKKKFLQECHVSIRPDREHIKPSTDQ